MEEKKNKRQKKIRNYVIICAMLAIILSVSTYAWFIGLQDVKVSAFDVNIKAADSLMLSIDGSSWNSTISINSANYNSAAYANNTNSWGGEDGLIPMSSVGEVNKASSTMKIYEKASLTSTPDGMKTSTAGGYRLLASRVNNMTIDTGKFGGTEQAGYVAFDLFVKNFSGTEYYTENNILNEEAIYLTTDSKVTVASTGVANTGIENSVRVAFAPIGRVIATTADGASSILNLTCNHEEASLLTDPTSICRDAQIWEPNDTAHVAGATSWYNTSCRTRTGEDITLKASYDVDEPCETVSDGTAYHTYAVRDVVEIADKVDIYDGEDYNTYNSTIMEYTQSQYIGDLDSTSIKKLEAYPYFTDTDKVKTGTSRPTFMTLAPNSITKVRVYVWIEGQDIDNYDYASAGKAISVGFGFTKERYVTTDVSYAGPFVSNQYVYTTGLYSAGTYVTTADLDDFTSACEALGAEIGIDASDNTVCAQQYHFFSANIEGAHDIINTDAGLQVYPYQDKVHK